MKMAPQAVASELQWWIALIGIIVPLTTLSGTAAYVVRLFQDAGNKRRGQFFELMQYIDSPTPIASKMAAVYQLRQFPEHRDFVIRFCESQRGNIAGAPTSVGPLQAEMDGTRDFMRTV